MAFKNTRQLLDEATATNSPPSVTGAGVPTQDGIQLPGGRYDRGTIIVKSTAGSGTLTVTLKLWGYVEALDAWAPLGTNAADANRGVLNQANAIGEVQADSLQFAELIEGLATFDRVYLEITAIGGASTAVSAWLVLRNR